jgi:hypothetical protein
VIGAIGNIFGVRPALTVAALVLSPTLLLYVHAMKSGGVDPEAKPRGWSSRPKRVLLAVKELNSSNSDEIYRIFVDVWLFGA